MSIARTLAELALMWRSARTFRIDYEGIAIEAGEIRMRPFRASDLERLLEVVRDPEIVRFSYLPDAWRTEEGAREYLASLPALAATGERIDLAVELPRGGPLVGHAALREISWRLRRADLATWVAPDQRGSGIGAAALRSLADWAFGELGLRSVKADPDLENVASQRMCEQAGMEAGETIRTSDGRTVVLYRREAGG